LTTDGPDHAIEDISWLTRVAIIGLPLLALIAALLMGLIVGLPLALAGIIISCTLFRRAAGHAVLGIALSLIALVVPVVIGIAFGQ
jgi:lysylphosphatidylglycerol synthetase-like protein (DUF2156 family)